MVFSLKRYFSLKFIGANRNGELIYEDCYGDRWSKSSRWSLFAFKI